MLRASDPEICAVCQDNVELFGPISTTPCGHTFHFGCLAQNLVSSPNCPVCRAKILPGDTGLLNGVTDLTETDYVLSESDSSIDSDLESVEVEIPAFDIPQDAFHNLVNRLEQLSDSHDITIDICMPDESSENTPTPGTPPIGVPPPPPPRILQSVPPPPPPRMLQSVPPPPPPPRMLPPTPSNIIHYLKRGDVSEVETMLTYDRRLVSTVDGAGDTLLHLAVMSQNEYMVRFLATNARMPIDVTNRARMTPLHYSVFTSNVRLVTLVLNMGCFVDSGDSSGKTPLMYAAMHNNTDVLELLLRRGANFNSFDMVGETSLHHASRCRCLASVRILAMARHCNVDVENFIGETPLHLACVAGSHACVRFLMISGASPTKRTKAGKLPSDCVTSRREGLASILTLISEHSR